MHATWPDATRRVPAASDSCRVAARTRNSLSLSPPVAEMCKDLLSWPLASELAPTCAPALYPNSRGSALTGRKTLQFARSTLAMGDKRALTTMGGRKFCSKRLNLTGASPASAWLACRVQVSYCSTRQQHLVRYPIIQVATRPGRSSAHVMYSVGTAGVSVPRHAHLCSPLFQVRIAWTTLDILQVAQGLGGRLIWPIKSSSIVSLGTEPWDRLHQKTQTG